MFNFEKNNNNNLCYIYMVSYNRRIIYIVFWFNLYYVIFITVHFLETLLSDAIFVFSKLFLYLS